MTDFDHLPPPPQSREEILAAVGDQRAEIYRTVRRILDDFEDVAPWEELYYPPTEVAEFLQIQTGMVALISEIPYRISEMTTGILSQAFASLLDGVSDTRIDPGTRRMILGLLAPGAAKAATRSTLRVAQDAVDSVPDELLAEPQRRLLKWLLDRYAQKPSVELTEDAYDHGLVLFPDDILDRPMKQILSNAQFYFDGIHAMTMGDIEKLQARIELFQTAEAANLSAQERVFTCEISADLKGKYTSAIMGAAANLIAEGRWNGAEIEPVLFPEKAAEFQRNEQLVTTLREVLESIKRLPEEVPLVDLVARWQKGQRVDRYALSHLFGFLGNLGKLMKESSRRALYSGDYHQIQLREHRLSNRINELNMLHNRTWDVVQDEDASIQECYPLMADKAVELAAILDVELLKRLIGDDTVHLLLRVVSIEGEKRRELDVRLGYEQQADYRTPESSVLREKLPERREPLIELLYDEDLYTFLELLLGSVLKRASFTVKHRVPEAEGPATMPEEAVRFEDVRVLEAGGAPPGARGETPSADRGDEAREKLAVLDRLRGDLDRITSASSPHRQSFDLVHRLLTRKGMIPPAMLQSILPFLEDLTDTLLPQLADVSAQGDLPITYQSDLMQYCRALARRDLTPREMKTEVLTNMEGLLSLLGDLEAVTLEVIDAHSPAAAAAGESGDLLGSVDDFLNPIE